MQALEDLSDPYGEPDGDADDAPGPIPGRDGRVVLGPGESWGRVGGEPRFLQREIGPEGLSPNSTALPGGGSADVDELNAEGLLTHDLLAKMDPERRREYEGRYGTIRETGPDLFRFGPDAEADAEREKMRRMLGGAK